MTENKKQLLFALDLDGTTLNSEGVITEKVHNSIVKARKEGHILAVVSGRTDFEILSLKETFKSMDYIILNNGGKIIRGSDGKVISDKFLDEKESIKLLNLCLENDYVGYATTPKDWYITKITDRMRKYCESIGYLPKIFTDVSEIETDRIEAISILDNTEEFKRIINYENSPLRALDADASCIDVMRADCDKYHGLMDLLEILNFPIENVVAVGDYDNDAQMIENAGFGVAVANANDKVKAVADHVSKYSNDEAVVHHVIEDCISKVKNKSCL